MQKLIQAFVIILSQCLGALSGALLASFTLSVRGKVPAEYVPVLAPEGTVADATGYNEDL